jgi:hypothetical protein
MATEELCSVEIVGMYYRMLFIVADIYFWAKDLYTRSDPCKDLFARSPRPPTGLGNQEIY